MKTELHILKPVIGEPNKEKPTRLIETTILP